MNILTVIPLAKGIPRDELSYFSARDVMVGTMVTVPFGGRKIRAVVADAQPVRNLKARIKGASFQLKNIIEAHAETLPQNLFSAAQNTSRFFAQPVGGIVETMIPKDLFEFYISAHAVIPGESATASSGRDPGPRNNTGIPDRLDTIAVRDDVKMLADIELLQTPYSERISIYKTLIRENLAKKTSTIIITPTIIQAERIFEVMKTGIEDRIFVMHGKITKKKLTSSIQAIFAAGTLRVPAADPVVVIATAPFSSIIRNDWSTVIIEESSSPYYRYEFGPRFDMCYFVEHAFAHSSARIIYADTFIGIDLRARAQRREISDLRSTWHIARPEDFKLLDLRPQENPSPTLPQGEGVAPKTISRDAAKKSPDKKPFSLFHDDTRALIERAIPEKSNIVLLANRKGLAPLTVCSDCATTVTCPHCNTPLVLHRKKSGEVTARTYICHNCLRTTPPIDHCATCFGSRLALLGISTDSIYEEVSKLFPKAEIFLANDEEKSLQKVMKDWAKASSGILIGTHGVLPYLETIPYGAIVSFDSLLSLPAYTSAETALHTILTFLDKVTNAAIIQTRNAGHDAVQAIQNENLFDFVRNEIESRTQFGYPPTKILIKVSLDAKINDVKKVTEYFETIFKSYDPDILMKKSRKPDQVIVQSIMKIDPAVWNDPNSQIQITLHDLPREFVREINPDSVV